MKKKDGFVLSITYGAALITALLLLIWSLIDGDYERITYIALGVAALLFPRLLSFVFFLEMPVLTESISVLVIVGSCMAGEALRIYERLPVWDDLMHLLSGFLFCAFGFAVWKLRDGGRRALAGFCFATTAGVMWEFIEYFCDRVLHTDMQKDVLLTSVSSRLLAKGDGVGHLRGITEVVLGGTPLSGILDIGLYDTMNDLVMASVGTLIFLVLYRMDLTRGTHFARVFIPHEKEK